MWVVTEEVYCEANPLSPLVMVSFQDSAPWEPSSSMSTNPSSSPSSSTLSVSSASWRGGSEGQHTFPCIHTPPHPAHISPSPPLPPHLVQDALQSGYLIQHRYVRLIATLRGEEGEGHRMHQHTAPPPPNQPTTSTVTHQVLHLLDAVGYHHLLMHCTGRGEDLQRWEGLLTLLPHVGLGIHGNRNGLRRNQ